MARQLSEKEIQQRRDAAKARWDKHVSTATAVGATTGALAGGLIGASLGRDAAASFIPKPKESPKGPGRNFVAERLRSNPVARRAFVNNARKVRESYVSQKNADSGAEVKAGAAERKILEEAANRGETITDDVRARAKAFGDKVRGRSRKGAGEAVNEEGGRRARSYMRSSVRDAVRQFKNFPTSKARLPRKYAMAAGAAGAATVGGLGAVGSALANRNAYEEISPKQRRIAFTSSAAVGASAGGLLGATLARRRGALVGAMIGGAGSASLAAASLSEGDEERPRNQKINKRPNIGKSENLGDLAKAYKKSRLRRAAEHGAFFGAGGAAVGAGAGLAAGAAIGASTGTLGTGAGAKMTRGFMRRGAKRLGVRGAAIGGLIGALRGPKKD